MTRQLPLPLSLPPFATLDNFIVEDNQQLLDHLYKLIQWDQPEQLFLSGPTGCGKSHLLMGICDAAEKNALRSVYLPLSALPEQAPELLHGLEEVDLLCIDDLHCISARNDWEMALFNLFNACLATGCKLVFSANNGPAVLPISLPDLRSRLSWGTAYQVKPLSQEGLAELLIQQARQRGLSLEPRVADYLVSHYKRQADCLISLLERLDRASLAQQRKLTLPFVREQLQT